MVFKKFERDTIEFKENQRRCVEDLIKEGLGLKPKYQEYNNLTDRIETENENSQLRNKED